MMAARIQVILVSKLIVTVRTELDKRVVPFTYFRAYSISDPVKKPPSCKLFAHTAHAFSTLTGTLTTGCMYERTFKLPQCNSTVQREERIRKRAELKRSA